MEQLLPNDIIEKIYFCKHKLEMKDVFEELNEVTDNTIYDIEALILYMKNCTDYDALVDIYIALRNDGKYEDDEIIKVFDKFNEDISFRNALADEDDELMEEIDTNLCMCNDIISINDIKKEYNDILSEACLLKQDYDEWMYDNVR